MAAPKAAPDIAVAAMGKDSAAERCRCGSTFVFYIEMRPRNAADGGSSWSRVLL